MDTRGSWRITGALLVATCGLAAFSGVALAHGGSLRGAAGGDLSVPTWLFLLTGGGAVGGSFLLASLVTDRAFVHAIHARAVVLPAPRELLRWTGRAIGLLGLVYVVTAGFWGPVASLRNAAILVVWVGWWAGFAMVTYLVGNGWPAVDPARTLARGLRRALGPRRRTLAYPEALGSWPAVIGLLALVWVEIVSPLADDPRLLAAAVVAYVGLATAGATAVGVETWTRRIDPVSAVFRLYGLVAPIQRTDDGLRLVVPGSALVGADLDADEAAVVVALLWGTTFDGLVATPAWAALAPPVVAAGVPPRLLYLLAHLVGFAAFLGAYLLATRLVRRTAPTYVASEAIASRFAASLLPIAAGYHLAHYLGYFLALSPALAGALLSPAAPPPPRTLVLPGWFGAVAPVAVLGGHLLAIWAAHGVAFRLFPGRLQAIRSQYPLTAVMVGYTIVSLWIVSRPEVVPPYL